MERKSKTYVGTKHGKIYLKHNSISDDIPIVIALKAMGMQSDKEITQLVCGHDSKYVDKFSPNLEECSQKKIFTQQQALDYIGARVKSPKRAFGPGIRRPPVWFRRICKASKVSWNLLSRLSDIFVVVILTCYYSRRKLSTFLPPWCWLMWKFRTTTSDPSASMLQL